MQSVHLGICGIKTAIKLPSTNGFYHRLLKRYHNFLVRPSVRNRISVSVKNENIYQLDSLLRKRYAEALLDRGGFMLHACGISEGRNGYLFAGQSGSGKTTLARKSSPGRVLSDELVAVRVKGNRVFISGTPFLGEFKDGGQPIEKPLRAIYFLSKGDSLKLSRISTSECLKRMLKLVFFFSKDAVDTGKLLKLLKTAVSNLTPYEIRLTRQASYKRIIEYVKSSK
ncbi:MAG: hypothetical protein HY762_08270 [Planctomycetes bacterium]|nr:hypothetical protein [Planctomycetota bacterium]